MKYPTLSYLSLAVLAAACLTAISASGQTAKPVKLLQTESGIRFGVLGEKGHTPAPTLFVFDGHISIEATLRSNDLIEAGRILGKAGCIYVSLDIPCHGQDVQPGEAANSLGCWRSRIEKGDDWVTGFDARVSAVLDDLVQKGYTDPHQVAAFGTSRGGFIAFHFAAAEPRVKAVAAFAPVTDLLALSEFAGMGDGDSNPALRLANSFALVNVAEKLAGRSFWVCIGNHDRRVSTEAAIAFTRRVVEASTLQGKPADVELLVVPTLGHRVHASAYEDAAAWLLTRIQGTH